MNPKNGIFGVTDTLVVSKWELSYLFFTNFFPVMEVFELPGQKKGVGPVFFYLPQPP